MRIILRRLFFTPRRKYITRCCTSCYWWSKSMLLCAATFLPSLLLFVYFLILFCSVICSVVCDKITRENIFALSSLYVVICFGLLSLILKIWMFVSSSECLAVIVQCEKYFQYFHWPVEYEENRSRLLMFYEIWWILLSFHGSGELPGYCGG